MPISSENVLLRHDYVPWLGDYNFVQSLSFYFLKAGFHYLLSYISYELSFHLISMLFGNGHMLSLTGKLGI